MTPHRSRPLERGAILVTSLLLLLILTVLGVAVMRMTGLQERMAGNTRDLNLALQGAEAALRDAEGKIRALPFEPDFSFTPGCEYCGQGVLPVDLDNPSSFNWNALATEFDRPGRRDIEELREDPRYTVEETAFVRDSFNLGQDGVVDGREIFTVTSRSTGASGQTNTVLQSTYARRF